MKQNAKANYIIIPFICILISIVIYTYFKIPKTGFIEINQVYNEFDLKKELETKLSNVQNSRNKILDSLKLQVSIMSKKLNDQPGLIADSLRNEFEIQRQQFLLKQKQFEEDNQLAVSQYNEQVFKQLNQFVKDYAKEHNYDLILGADGSGAVMYAKENWDITKDIIAYVNKRFNGGK